MSVCTSSVSAVFAIFSVPSSLGQASLMEIGLACFLSSTLSSKQEYSASRGHHSYTSGEMNSPFHYHITWRSEPSQQAIDSESPPILARSTSRFGLTPNQTGFKSKKAHMLDFGSSSKRRRKVLCTQTWIQRLPYAILLRSVCNHRLFLVQLLVIRVTATSITTLINRPCL